jgi:hypothetical protein
MPNLGSSLRSHDKACFPAGAFAQINFVATDNATALMDRDFRIIFPQFQGLVLDPVHLAMVSLVVHISCHSLRFCALQIGFVME